MIFSELIYSAVGKKFGKLEVIKPTKKVRTDVFYLCKCDCGKECEKSRNNIITGHTKSCGCLYEARNLTHGLSSSKEYAIYYSMLQRCHNPQHKYYRYYGARGIKVCKRWRDSFENFYRDMGAKLGGMSLDRIDNSKGYSKSNCRWTTRKQQQNNTRGNYVIPYKGKGMSVAMWCDLLGLPYGVIQSRIKRGKTPKQAFETPIRKRTRK